MTTAPTTPEETKHYSSKLDHSDAHYIRWSIAYRLREIEPGTPIYVSDVRRDIQKTSPKTFESSPLWKALEGVPNDYDALALANAAEMRTRMEELERAIEHAEIVAEEYELTDELAKLKRVRAALGGD